MKLKKGTLLFLLLTCLAYTTLAQTDHILKYEDITIDGNGIITACSYNFSDNADGTNLTIPKSVKPKDGAESQTIIIKGIEGSFFVQKNLVSLTFANDSEVTTIGNAVFLQNHITTLTLPASLTTIGLSAFSGNGMKELTFPEDSQLTTIGVSAFYLNQITTLDLPTALTSIGKDAFYNNPSLDSFTLPLVTKEGFRTYWQDNNLVDLETNLTIPKADFRKSFELVSIEQFTLTVEVNDKEGGSIEPSDDHFAIDKADAPSTQELTATPNDGWRFDKWVISDEEDKTDETTTITLDADKTATAHFVQLVTLTTAVAEQQGGTISANPNPYLDNQYDIKTEVTLTAKPNTGWRFDKWVISDEQEKTDKITTITLNTDKSVTAHFVQLVTLTTAVAEQQGGTISANPNPYLDNQYDIKTEVTLTATPADGWRFDKWVITGEDNKKEKTTTITFNTDKTATAHFVEIVTLTVEVNDKKGGSIEPSDDHFAIDKADAPSTQELTATPADGWRFDKWVITSGEDEDGNPITETVDVVGVKVTVDADKTATAHFVEQVTLTLTIVETGASGVVSGLSAGENKIDKGADFKLKAMPASGQRFVSWTIGVETIVTEEYTLPATDTEANIGITVTFEAIPQQVTLTLVIEGKGSINPSIEPNSVDPDNEMKGMYDINTEIELTAKPNDGWKFDKWEISDEENKTDKTTTITLDKNKSVTAHFVEEGAEEAITSILTEVVSAIPYPNPVTSQITLKAKDGDLIQLFSPKGKQQYSTQHTGNEVHTIDVSTLPVGVYLVRITDAEGNTTTKRILKK